MVTFHRYLPPLTTAHLEAAMSREVEGGGAEGCHPSPVVEMNWFAWKD